jgi:hypothetical protein
MWFTNLLLFLTTFTASGVRASGSLGRRDTTDTCASLNTELVVPNQLGILTAVGIIGE